MPNTANSAIPSIAGSVANSPQSRRDYIWLVYSVFFFIEPVLRHNRVFWLKCVALYTAFLAIYVGCMRARSTRTSVYWVWGFTAVGLLSYPINDGGSTFFVYTAAILPLCIPRVRVVVGALSGVAALVLAEGMYFHINWISVDSTVMFLAVIGSTNFFVGKQKEADCKLRMANEEIEQLAALAERERIARDLHDVLGHTLSLIVLKSELAGRLLREGPTHNPARAAAEIADVESTARTALHEVREAIGGYRAQGLAAELEQARRTLDAAGVSLRCDADTRGAAALTVTQETVLSLAVREAVTNIVRHAEATSCRVTVSTENGFHALRVEDDGTHRISQEGNGLRGMRERVAALGGLFCLETGVKGTGVMEVDAKEIGAKESSAGTRLLIRLPIAAAGSRV